MPKLASHHQFAPTQETVQRILSHYGLPLSRFELATGGIENITGLIRSGSTRYVLRVYRQHRKSDDAIQLELDFMAFLRKNRLPVPTIMSTPSGHTFAVTELAGRRWQSILMEYAPGRHPTRYTPKLVEDMAQLQAKMHLLGEQYANECHITGDINELRLQDPLVLERLLNDPTVSAEKRAFVERAQRYVVELDRRLPRGLSHFDYEANNLFTNAADQVTAILDFDDVRYMPLIVCLGYTLHEILAQTDNNLSLIKRYLQAYEAIRPIRMAEKIALPEIMLFRQYLVTLITMYFGGGGLDKGNGDAFKKALAQERYFSETLAI